MSRDGSGVYTLPSGYLAVTGQTIEATQHNTPLEDLETDMNTARPIVAGGTGSTTAAGARDALDVDSKVISKSANYTAVAGDRSKVIYCTAAMTLNLTAAATLADGWFVVVKAEGGDVTVDPDGSETINGAGTIDITDGGFAEIYCNGTTFYANEVVLATDATAGLVEKSTSAENTAGTATDKYPDVAGVKEMIDEFAAPISTVTAGMVLLAAKTASASASLDFTEFDATKYHGYKFVLLNVVPAGTNTSLRLRYSTDGGSTYISTSSYVWAGTEADTAPATNARGSSSDTEIVVARTVESSNGGANGEISIMSPDVSEKTHATFLTSYYSGSNHTSLSGAGRSSAVTVVDAAQFSFGTGNIASGTIVMYGLAK